MITLNSYLIVAFLYCQSLWAIGVSESSGNIYVRSEDGKLEQLTSLGLDSSPAISGDGSKVLFVRKQPEGFELRAISLTRSRKNLLVLRENDDQLKTSERSSAENVASSIVAPQFSPDGNEIFFYSQPGNLGVIWRVDIAKRTAKMIAHSVIPMQKNAFEVVPSGKFKGDLIVQKDAEKLTPGRLFLFWLIDPEGRNIGIVGTNDSDVDQFRDQY